MKEGVIVYQLGVYQLGSLRNLPAVSLRSFEARRFPHRAKVWVSILVLAVFCTGFSFVAQTIAQQYTSASHVGVIFSLEPVFAALVAFCRGRGTLSQGVFGSGFASCEPVHNGAGYKKICRITVVEN